MVGLSASGVKTSYEQEQERLALFLDQNPVFVNCAFAAHKTGFLLSYLTAKGAHQITPRDIEHYEPLLSALFDHPKFRSDWIKRVSEGIITACQTMFPFWWKN